MSRASPTPIRLSAVSQAPAVWLRSDLLGWLIDRHLRPWRTQAPVAYEHPHVNWRGVPTPIGVANS